MPIIQPNVSTPATHNPPGDHVPRRASTHRIYRHTEGGPYIPCRTVSHEELVALAEGADRVQFHEAALCTRLRMADIAIFLEALRGLPWVESTSNPDQVRRDLRRQIRDRRARIRIKDGRHFLAGMVTHGSGETEERVLLLILAGSGVLTCDWQLEP